MTQKELNIILDKLISLGANKDEAELWRTLYPTMPYAKKLVLDKNFREELEQLSLIK